MVGAASVRCDAVEFERLLGQEGSRRPPFPYITAISWPASTCPTSRPSSRNGWTGPARGSGGTPRRRRGPRRRPPRLPGSLTRRWSSAARGCELEPDQEGGGAVSCSARPLGRPGRRPPRLRRAGCPARARVRSAAVPETVALAGRLRAARPAVEGVRPRPSRLPLWPLPSGRGRALRPPCPMPGTAPRRIALALAAGGRVALAVLGSVRLAANGGGAVAADAGTSPLGTDSHRRLHRHQWRYGAGGRDHRGVPRGPGPVAQRAHAHPAPGTLARWIAWSAPPTWRSTTRSRASWPSGKASRRSLWGGLNIAGRWSCRSSWSGRSRVKSSAAVRETAADSTELIDAVDRASSRLGTGSASRSATSATCRRWPRK